MRACMPACMRECVHLSQLLIIRRATFRCSNMGSFLLRTPSKMSLVFPVFLSVAVGCPNVLRSSTRRVFTGMTTAHILFNGQSYQPGMWVSCWSELSSAAFGHQGRQDAALLRRMSYKRRTSRSAYKDVTLEV